jgi:anti-sigma regulatory factor (Ser/Thr protein kinase)
MSSDDGGPAAMDTSRNLVVPATAGGLHKAEEGLDEFSAAHGLTRNDTWPFHVAIDEILSNIVKYGHPEGAEDSRVEIRLRLEAESLEMIILDDAAPFNPLDAERPDTALAAEDREIGGLGIEIVRRLMDTIEYDRVDDRKNRLTLRRRLGL